MIPVIVPPPSIPDCDYRLRVLRERMRRWAGSGHDCSGELRLIDELLAARMDLAMAEAAELTYRWSESPGGSKLPPPWPVPS